MGKRVDILVGTQIPNLSEFSVADMVEEEVGKAIGGCGGGGGGRGTGAPGPKFLHFLAVFGENWPNNRLASPSGDGALVWEILDPPLKGTMSPCSCKSMSRTRWLPKMVVQISYFLLPFYRVSGSVTDFMGTIKIEDRRCMEPANEEYPSSLTHILVLIAPCKIKERIDDHISMLD